MERCTRSAAAAAGQLIGARLPGRSLVLAYRAGHWTLRESHAEHGRAVAAFKAARAELSPDSDVRAFAVVLGARATRFEQAPRRTQRTDEP